MEFESEDTPNVPSIIFFCSCVASMVVAWLSPREISNDVDSDIKLWNAKEEKMTDTVKEAQMLQSPPTIQLCQATVYILKYLKFQIEWGKSEHRVEQLSARHTHIKRPQASETITDIQTMDIETKM